ncbi:MAG: glycosyltransferase family 39 protein [Clostridia bacterium]|nr:glycosyltransferase family 39 protein [Clostridia bacterium]
MGEGRLSSVKRSVFSNVLCLLPFAFLLILLAFFLFYDQSAHKFEENCTVAELVTGIALLGSAVSGFLLYKKNKLNTNTVVVLLFVCGFALRLAYALRYGYNVHQHDVEGLNSSGHLSYIYSIATGNGLPTTNDWQFSHPPLHHFLAALSVKLSYALGFTNGHAFENIQYLTVLYSSLTMLVGYEMLKEFGVKNKNLVFGVMLLTFHPTFQVLAGSINNDILLVLLSMSVVLFLMKWYRSPSLKYAALCGAFCGLSMMTKVSAALIAVVAAVTVVVKFIADKELKLSKTLLQTAVFLVLLLPLGLWHPIRNYILFEQPLGYVAPIPTTSALYIGDISIIDRLVLPFSKDSFGVYVDVWEEYNVWFYTLRNSLFGEYSFGNMGLASLAVFSNLLVILSSLTAFVYLIVKRRLQPNLLPIAVLFVVQLGFFIYFNIKYPFGCTMDFRYIVPLLFCGILFLCGAAERLGECEDPISKWAVFGTNTAVTVLCVTSTLVMF